MSNDKTSVVLISKDKSSTEDLSSMLRSHPRVRFQECTATLSEMNGTASKLAATNDLVIFKTEQVTDHDLSALHDLRKNAGDRAFILALSDGNTTLADVQRLTRAGVNEVIADTVSSTELEAQIDRWSSPASRARSSAFKPQGKIISVAQSRGGVGATTLAVNLADELLGRKGRFKKTAQNRVALIDLDLQFGSIASFLDLPQTNALFQLAMDGNDPDEVFLAQSLTHLPSGLAVLTSPAGIAPLEALNKRQVSKMLELLRSEFDYVVIDLPHALVEWISPVLESSDRMMLVTDSSVPAIHQARRRMDVYTDDNPGLEIEIVINNESKPMMLKKHHTEASKVLKRKFRHWLPHHPGSAREATDRGMPLSQIGSRSPLGNGIRRLAVSTMAELGAKAEQTQQVH